MFQEPTEVLICFKCIIKNFHLSFEIFFFAKLLNRNSITHWYPPPPRIREIQLDPSPMLLPAVRRTTPRRQLPPTKDQGSGQLLSKLLLPYILLPWKTKKQKVYTISQAWKQGWSTFVLDYLSWLLDHVSYLKLRRK